MNLTKALAIVIELILLQDHKVAVFRDVVSNSHDRLYEIVTLLTCKGR
jgi:hypothetical protein